jgi:hypothetical protein
LPICGSAGEEYMARSTSTSSGRTRITAPTRDVLTDDGTALISLVKGEQIQIEFTAAWMTNLLGSTITAKVIEGDNSVLGTKPLVEATTPIITTLEVIDAIPTDNVFKLVFPETLTSTWSTAPLPNKPVYGFFGIEIADAGVGSAQQIWKPVRGLVEVLYSPTEAI